MMVLDFCCLVLGHLLRRPSYWPRIHGCDSLHACCEQVLIPATSVRKSWKLLARYWCNLLEICPMVKSKLVTFNLDFDLESYFVFFKDQAIPFKWLYLATSFLVWWYNFGISRSPSSFKVIRFISRSRLLNSGSAQAYAPLRHCFIVYWRCGVIAECRPFSASTWFAITRR